jgi:imidazolonepropionase-like amidohydrolase
MTPMQALVAATSTAGRVLGFAETLGVLRPGAIGDLLLVRGDPSVDIAALRQVHAVVQQGRLVREP